MRSTAELIRIAQDEEDSAAIDELLVRRDPTAVAGLSGILLDEGQSVALRSCAAHALGEIGGEEARAALERVRASHPHQALKTAVDYSLDIRMAQPKSDE